MNINGIQIHNLQQIEKNQGTNATQITKQFSSFLTDAMNEMNRQQAEVNDVNMNFLVGDMSDVHQVMITAEKAQLGIQLAVQVRNKVIESYQEVMRMQI